MSDAIQKLITTVRVLAEDGGNAMLKNSDCERAQNELNALKAQIKFLEDKLTYCGLKIPTDGPMPGTESESARGSKC